MKRLQHMLFIYLYGVPQRCSYLDNGKEPWYNLQNTTQKFQVQNNSLSKFMWTNSKYHLFYTNAAYPDESHDTGHFLRMQPSSVMQGLLYSKKWIIFICHIAICWHRNCSILWIKVYRFKTINFCSNYSSSFIKK